MKKIASIRAATHSRELPTCIEKLSWWVRGSRNYRQSGTIFCNGSQSSLQYVIVYNNVKKAEAVEEAVKGKGQDRGTEKHNYINGLQSKYVDIRVCWLWLLEGTIIYFVQVKYTNTSLALSWKAYWYNLYLDFCCSSSLGLTILCNGKDQTVTSIYTKHTPWKMLFSWLMHRF